MKSSLRLAGAAVLCASLLLTACAKKDTSSSTTSADASKTTTTDTSVATATPADAGATPAADATTAPADTSAASTAAPAATAATGSSGGIAFIEMPVYPGTTEAKDQSMSVASNGSSVVLKVYTTKDDTKHVIDWYKSHLPAAWKNFQLTSGDKTTGTFSNEGADGDQTVLISTQDDKTTRIQLSTKHGK